MYDAEGRLTGFACAATSVTSQSCTHGLRHELLTDLGNRMVSADVGAESVMDITDQYTAP